MATRKNRKSAPPMGGQSLLSLQIRVKAAV